METVETNNGLAPFAYELPWSFKNQPVKVELRECGNSNKVVVNLHGTYGIMHGNSWKYGDFARKVAESGLASSIVYSTSRDWQAHASSDGSYEARMETFRGKNFEDELADARAVISDLVSNSLVYFKTAPESLEIVLHGNSLGGIIAFYLAAEFPQVTAIFTVGTGLRLEPKNIPILSTFPKAEEVKGKISEFRGDYVLECGTADDVFSQESFEDLFEAAKPNANRACFLTYEGVDHSFKSVGGEKYPQVFDEVTERVISYLEGKAPESGRIVFDTKKRMSEVVLA